MNPDRRTNPYAAPSADIGTAAESVFGWGRKLTVVGLLLVGAAAGWLISFWLWSEHMVNGGDDPSMLLVVVLCMLLPTLPVAWRYRGLALRLAAYCSIMAGVAWVLRPQMDGWVPFPRQFQYLGHHQFHDFYPTLIVPVAVIGAVVAVIFTRRESD